MDKETRWNEIRRLTAEIEYVRALLLHEREDGSFPSLVRELESRYDSLCLELDILQTDDDPEISPGEPS